ncbi:MAG TPA: HAD hydrolase-like protein, partial [archaeon]|nr:HAD hydrolase-like protein [archaeon]
MIRVVLFDVDGVLLDSFDANTKFFQELIKNSGYKKPPKNELANIFHANMLDTIRLLTKEKSEEKITEIWKKGHTFPYPNGLLKMPADSLGTIKKLKQKYKLGIVTNRIERGINIFFEVSKMREYFD